jgi:aryl-phospho-beta-D-glucosidase BglC (GH1 family)
LLQGFKSKSEMERYAPELYEATFGPGGAEDILLPNLRSEKEAKRKLRELKKAIKDEMYNYEPKKEEKKGWFGGSEFGGSEFGKQKKGKGFGGSKFGGKGFGQ